MSLFKGVATLRLRGGKSGRRRKCAGLRRGGRVRKKDAYLRRKRETKRDEERSTVPLKGRGGKRKVVATDQVSDSDDDIPDDLDLLSLPVLGGGVKKREVVSRPKPSPEDELRFQKAWEEKRGHGDGQLVVAIKFRRLKEARRLLDAGAADPNTYVGPPILQRTLLHQAVLDDDLATAELLCRKGADLFALDNKFINPTKLSMRKGNIDMFSLLQSWGGVADPQKTHLSRR